jgi:hypothetical protein
MASCLKLTFVACSTLVCRPRSGRNRAPLLETIRRGRANPTRKRIFGGAWVHSATVRSCTRVSPLLPVRTDRVLFARVAGAYLRCPCTKDTILAAKDIYGLYGTIPQADLLVAGDVVRRDCDDCDGVVLQAGAADLDARPVPVLGCMC